MNSLLIRAFFEGCGSLFQFTNSNNLMERISTLFKPFLNLLLLTFLGVSSLTAQSLTALQDESCGFDQRHKELLRTDPRYRQQVQEFDALVRNFDVSGKRGGGTLTVPVVVHVMETGTAITAITDEQVRDGIRWLNERYRKVPGTLGDGNGVDINMEFALAVRDPSGNCTNGITRRDMTGNATYMANGVFSDVSGISDASLKLLDVWPQTQYYNIWLISEFDNNNGGGGVQGYAFFSSSHGQPNDGTVMLVNAYKNPQGITLAHELGHAFNVYHTFEGDAGGTGCPTNGNCISDGDQVCDTPPHIRSNSDCNFSGTNGCDGGSAISLFKNNYMDYSGDQCQNMFTAGQNTRIQAAISGPRASFLAVNGNMALVPPGAPMLDFVASTALMCGTGQSVQLFDKSSCIPNTFIAGTGLSGITFSWSITNGTETHVSTQQNPVFTLNSAGVYNATVSITTGLGTYTRTEQGVVVVTAAPVAACTPTSTNECNCANTVNNVVFNTISNATSSSVNVAYTDFSCSQNTIVAVGSTYSLAVSLRGGGSGAESLNAYIDYNNNGVFEDPSERVASGSQPASSSGTIMANVTIPGTAVTNTLLRMRIYGEAGTLSASERACGSAFFIGDVEDYGVYISNTVAALSIAAAPGNTITYGTSVTFTPTPVNGGGAPVYSWLRNGVDVGTSATYVSNNLLPGETIQCSMASNLAGVISSPALSNTVTMVVTGPPLSEFNGSTTQLCAGSSVTFTDASLLSPTSWSWSFPGGTPSNSTAQNPVVSYASPGTYNVTLIASNGNGTGTTNTKTAYVHVLAVPTSGCSVTRTNTPTAGIGITNVQLNTINKTTVYNGAVMNDYTCSDVTTLSANTVYAISVTVGGSNDQWVRAYIDYNNDGDFVDAGEQIFAPAAGRGVRSGTFTTNASPTYGSLMRLRVISDFVNTTAGPCTSPVHYGQVEEYGVVFSAPAGIQVSARAFLEGPYKVSTGLMSDTLRQLALVPALEPYTNLGYSFSGGGGETVAPAVLAVTGGNAIVDWVVLELRDNATPTTVLASRSALLQRDGDVVGLDGTSALSFGLPAASYHVAVLHRNHLPIMTLTPVALSASPATVDFTVISTGTYGTGARKSFAGAFSTEALWAGDVNFDRTLKYTNQFNDRDLILVEIGGTVATNTVAGYLPTDVNLDGVVKYTNIYNDRDIILVNIGGTVATNTRVAQMP